MPPHVLIVDDSRIDRRLAEACLKRCHYDVVTAGNAPEALERIALHPVDVVVSDLHMPGDDGLELLRRVKEHDPLLPFVLMTGAGSEAIAVEALHCGANDYVAKVDLVTRLPAAVERVLEIGRQLRRQVSARDWILTQSLSLRVGNERSQLGALLPALLKPARELGILRETDEIRVAVALEEALLNAMIHGNLEVSSKLRELEGDAYEQEIERRSVLTPYASRHVTIDCHYTRERVRYRITDQGPGFNVRALPNPCDPDRLELSSGRGVLMMRAFMDDVSYNDKGNEVTLVKLSAEHSLKKPAGEERLQPAAAACHA